MKREDAVDDLAAGPGGIGLFGTRAGIRAVGSPVRVRILAALREGDCSFDELVALSKKAKSTVSVHLRGLLDEGIIGEKPDPDDQRKKIFFLQSGFVGSLSERAEIPNKDQEDLPALFLQAKDPFVFYRMMFRTIRVSLLAEGINIDPVLQDAGVRVGRAISGSLAAPDLPAFVRNAQGFWEKNNLGRIEVSGLSPVVLDVYDCFECGELPVIGRPACAFDAGVLSSLFGSHFGAPQRVRELRCYANGDDHCRFLIEALADKGSSG